MPSLGVTTSMDYQAACQADAGPTGAHASSGAQLPDRCVRDTSGYERHVRPLGILDSQTPKLGCYAFADSRAASVYPDWDEMADELMTNLTFDARPDDAHLGVLAGELEVLAGDAFTSRFAAPPRVPRRHGVQRMIHPQVGELRLSYETLALPDDDQRLVIYLPADDAGSVALDQIAGRAPRALRVVPS